MISTADTQAPEKELADIFQRSPGTTGESKLITNRFRRLWNGVEADEELYKGSYRNGDLTMRVIEIMGETTIQIMSLSIKDEKAGFSGSEIITEKDDLVHRLKVMEAQRRNIESNRWNDAMEG